MGMPTCEGMTLETERQFPGVWFPPIFTANWIDAPLGAAPSQYTITAPPNQTSNNGTPPWGTLHSVGIGPTFTETVSGITGVDVVTTLPTTATMTLSFDVQSLTQLGANINGTVSFDNPNFQPDPNVLFGCLEHP